MQFRFNGWQCCTVALVLLLSACGSPEEREAEYLESGKELYESGDFAKAAIEFRNALQINPTGVEARYFTGLIFEKKGNLRAAASAFHEVVLQDPTNRDAQLKIGQFALLNGDAAEASLRADKAIELQPAKSDGHTMKAAAFLMLGKLVEAEAEARAALAISPNDPDATIVLASQRARQGRFDDAMVLVDGSLKANPKTVSLLGLKLKLLHDQGRAAEVEQVLRELVEIEPNNPRNAIALAVELTAAGRIAEAQDEFRRAIEANQNSDALIATYADFLERQVGAQQAIEEAKTLAQRFSKNSRYAFLLASLYIKSSRLDEAEAVLRKLVEELDRPSERLDARVELARITLLRGDRPSAIEQLTDVLKQDSKNQRALLARAAIHFEDAKFDQAIADARAVLRDTPDSAPALAILSQTYLRTNEPELAISALRNLVEVAPGNVDIRLQLAGLMMTKSPDEAIKQLDAAIALRPDDAELMARKAQALIYSKRWDEGEVIGQGLAADSKTAALGHQILGEAAFARQDFPTAIAELRSAIDLGRDFSSVGPTLMEAYRQAKEPMPVATAGGTAAPGPAEALLTDRIAKDPGDVDALVLLSELRESQGQVAAAKDLLRRAIALKPDDRSPYLGLARILKTEGDLNGAAETLQAAAAKFPDDSLVLGSVAIAHELMGNYEAAKLAYESVLTKWPADMVAANNLAMLIADVWPHDKALLDRARLLVEDFRNSNNPILIDTLGWVQVRIGNVEDATIILKKAVDLQPDNQQVLYHYAVALSLKGLQDLARQTIDKALAGTPDFRGIDDARQLAVALR